MDVDKDKIIIRNYRKSDHEDTLEILQELSDLYHIGLTENQWKESSGLRQFKPNLKRITLVAEIEGKVIAMGVVEAKKTSLGEYIGYLENWSTKKEYLGKGIGQILANRAIKILESWGVDKIRIEFSYDADKKVIDVICKGGGFKPSLIVVERILDKNKQKNQ